MQYIQSTLLQNENTIHWTRPHWIVFKTPAIVLLIALLLMSALPLLKLIKISLAGLQLESLVMFLVILLCTLSFLKILIVYRTSEYGVTNKRVLMKYGWVSRDSLELFLNKVEAIRVDQTLAGRIFNYGTLTFIGSGGTKDQFHEVPKPLQFRKMIQQQIDLFK